MDYWKEAEKIYTDLEHKGYRMEFFSDRNKRDSYYGNYKSRIEFTEKSNNRDESLLGFSFNFPIEELLLMSDRNELEKRFYCVDIQIYEREKRKQLEDFLLERLEICYPKIYRHFSEYDGRCSEPLKMFHFYVTVAQKHYSSIISKAKEIVIEEG